MLKWVPENTKINFIGMRWGAFVLSSMLIVASLGLLFSKGLNFGIDFTGGTLIEVRTVATPDLSKLRGDLNGLELGGISIQEFGAPNDILIRLPEQAGGTTEQEAAITSVKNL